MHLLRCLPLSGLLLLLACSPKTGSQPPNIVYILADDLGYGDLGCYGQKVIQTPHIDQLAREGMLFTDHYAGSSVCAPSRAAFMTGFHSGHNRVRGNYETGPHGFGACLELRDQDVTIAEVLKEKGYVSAVIGKWGMGVEGTTGVPNKQGFDYSYGYLNQGHAHFQFPSYLFRNGERVEIPENRNLANRSFSNDLFTGEAVGFMENNRQKPFFLYLAYTTPHAEMLLPASATLEKYKGLVNEKPYVKKGEPDTTDNNAGAYRSQPYPAAAYAAQVSHLDSCVGVVVQKLKALGLDKNTLIMFTSDNGPHNEGGADPAYFTSSGPLRGKKRDLYEGGIRVPFIAKWPTSIAANSVSDHVSAFWDMLPTFAEVASIMPSASNTDGLSLLPTFLGKTEKQPRHEYLYWEFHENKSTDQAVRKGKWKAVRHDPRGNIELYDLSMDKGEKNNLAGQHPQIVREMAQIFDGARTSHPIWELKSTLGASN
jgi:arylsulfatase A